MRLLINKGSTDISDCQWDPMGIFPKLSSLYFLWSMITSSTRHSNLSESKLIRVWARVWATACSVLDESWVSSMKHWMVMGLSKNRIPQVPVVYHYVPQYPIMQVSHKKKRTCPLPASLLTTEIPCRKVHENVPSTYGLPGKNGQSVNLEYPILSTGDGSFFHSKPMKLHEITIYLRE